MPVLLRGGIRLKLPDGTERYVKLPPAGRVPIGGNGNFSVTFGDHLFLFWLVRVKGGWYLKDQRQAERTSPQTLRKIS